MKKLLTALLSLSIATSYAQPVPLPTKSATDTVRAHKMIADYQAAAAANPTKYPNPSSFIMNVSDLKNHLINTSPNDCYLHIYMAKDSEPFLAMIGTHKDNSDIVHDTNDPMVWCTSQHAPNCKTVFDGLDGPVRNDANGTGPKEPLRTNAKQDVLEFASNYQRAYPKSGGNTQSFLINTNDLRNYLNTQSTVTYLQAYLAINSTSSNADKLALILVGVDDNGKHVFFNDPQLGICVFDEVVPCPQCGVNDDINFRTIQQQLHRNSPKSKTKANSKPGSSKSNTTKKSGK